MRVYLAGPMSGIPQFNIPAFDAAANELRALGFDVVSPAEVDGPMTRALLMLSESGDHADLPQDESWSFYLSRDFRILADDGIQVIATLPGWEGSRGARLEVAVGRELGIPAVEFRTLACLQMQYGPLEQLPVTEETHEELTTTTSFEFYEDNPERQRSEHGGVKDNASKPRVDLLPSKPLMAAGRVMAFGAKKYKPHNWRLGLGWSDTYASAMRHLLAFMDGEDIDPESQEPHIVNALCQVLFLCEYYLTGTGTDDRWVSADREEARA